jgi:transposase-like protein
MRQEGRMAKRRTYTKEEREAVLADVVVLGVTEAGKKHGIPQTTVTQWARKEGVGRGGEPGAPRRSRSKVPASKGARPKRARSESKSRRGPFAAAPAEREPKTTGRKSTRGARPKRPSKERPSRATASPRW